MPFQKMKNQINQTKKKKRKENPMCWVNFNVED
jgi:hypothetical protein